MNAFGDYLRQRREELRAKDSKFSVRQVAAAVGVEPSYLSKVEREIIGRALQQTQFNRTQAASLLGISLRQLRYQMQKLEICAPDDHA